MPTRNGELAARLLRKEDQDLHVVNALAQDPETSDEVLGFHAQQAVEKLLKAVLAKAAGDFSPTQNLKVLFEELRANGIAYPVTFEESLRLNRFAVVLHCDDIILNENETFDRRWAIEAIAHVRAWAVEKIGAA